MTTTPLTSHPGVFHAHLHENLSIIVWTGAATRESVAVLMRLTQELRGRFPQRMSTIQLLAPERSKLPNADAREGLIEMARQSADLMVGVALVNPGSGFVASALTSLATSIAMHGFRGTGLPVKIMPSIEQAVEWLAPLHLQGTGVSVPSDRMLAAVRHAQAQVPADDPDTSG